MYLTPTNDGVYLKLTNIISSDWIIYNVATWLQLILIPNQILNSNLKKTLKES